MSGNMDHLKEENKTEAAETSSPARKMCKTCGERPTISDSCPLCPSCMRKKSMESRKTAPVPSQRKKTKEDKHPTEKAPTIENMAVNIDFGKFPLILKQLQDLADQEIRPLNLQLIYILKCHFEHSNAFSGEV
ncbi:MAG: hypothetical protein ACOYOS_01590 [Syntrophales bacterium]